MNYKIYEGKWDTEKGNEKLVSIGKSIKFRHSYQDSWNILFQMDNIKCLKCYMLLYFGFHRETVTCTLLWSWKLTYTYIFALFYIFIPYKFYFLSLKTYIKSPKSKGLGTFHPGCVSIKTLKCVTAYLTRQIRHYFIGFLKVPHVFYFSKIGR